MLNTLVKYARAQRLVVEPGFSPKTVKWLIWLSEQGQFLEVVPLGDADAKRGGQEFPLCPDLQQSELIAGGVTRSHFLVDTCEVVALHGASQDDKKQQKHLYFISLMEQAAGTMPEMKVAATALKDPQVLQQVQKHLEQHKAKASDKVTLRIGNTTLVESDAWHEWWRQHRASLQTGRAAPSHKMVCFATGQLVEPAVTHPKVSGLADVGGQTSGSVLVGFDKDAFASYGLSQSANCAVSEEAAHAYRSALNELLANHSYRLANAKVVYWFSKAVAQEDDPVAAIFGWDTEEQTAAAQQNARRLLRAIETGERPDLLDNVYYTLTVSGSGGRVVVRDWTEGSFEELTRNVNAWFADLSIVHREGDRIAPIPKFLAVLGALVRDLKDVPAPLAAQLFRSAVKHEPIPQSAMAQALARAKVDIVQDQPFHHARMGILKAYHIRQGGTRMEPHLNPKHPSPAYHCGRLMAVLASLQRAALGDVGGGVVQRFYAAASATPALVLGRILRTAQFHIDKVRGDSPALASWYETRIAEVMSAIGDTMPRALALEEQSLFALGYYQQIAHDRAGKSSQKEENTGE